jgi:hypothetical protein
LDACENSREALLRLYRSEILSGSREAFGARLKLGRPQSRCIGFDDRHANEKPAADQNKHINGTIGTAKSQNQIERQR